MSLPPQEEIKYYKKVSLPHIRTTVYFLDMKQLKGMPIQGSAYTMPMGDYTGKLSSDMKICVFIENIEKNVKKMTWMPIIAHEITHVLQYICEGIGAEIQEEKEHTAHMMSYMFAELLGLS